MSQTGRITKAAEFVGVDDDSLLVQVAREIRDVAEDDRGRKSGREPNGDRVRQRKPGWSAVIAMVVVSGLAANPIWDRLTGKSELEIAVEVAQLRGKIETFEGRLNSAVADDLQSAADHAVEFRELDGKLVALGKNVDLLLSKLEVPASERNKIPETSEATIKRHKQAEDALQARKDAAARRLVEQSVADSDTVR